MSQHTLLDLEFLERLSSAATKGPWTSCVEGRDHQSRDSFIETATERDLYLSGGTVADRDFVAAARTAVPQLIHEVRRLEAELKHLPDLMAFCEEKGYIK